MAYKHQTAERVERQMPDRAAAAVKAAYKQTLHAGLSVLIVENGKLVKVEPDLKRTEIRPAAQAVKIKQGTKFKLK